jgi:hypothetical protein
MPVIPATEGSINRRIAGKTRAYLKTVKAKRAKGIAQVVRHLPNALSSTPSIPLK